MDQLAEGVVILHDRFPLNALTIDDVRGPVSGGKDKIILADGDTLCRVPTLYREFGGGLFKGAANLGFGEKDGFALYLDPIFFEDLDGLIVIEDDTRVF